MANDEKRTTPPSTPLTVVGWREMVALPEWKIRAIRAKVDTGARTSALDVENIRELPGDRVHFELVHDRRHPEQRLIVETPIVRRTRIKPSTGYVQERLVVKTRARIGGVVKEIEFSLVSRHAMICRMLLGRRALEGDFVVDPSQKYLHRRHRKSRSDGSVES